METPKAKTVKPDTVSDEAKEKARGLNVLVKAKKYYVYDGEKEEGTVHSVPVEVGEKLVQLGKAEYFKKQ